MNRASRPLAAVEGEALAWFVRNQGRTETDPGFEAWCAVDPAHEAAYGRVEAFWASPSLGGAAAGLKRRQRTAAATAVALPLALAVVIGLGGMKLAGLAPAWPADQATRVGEQSVAVLDDGTRLVLDTATAVDVVYTGEARTIRLRHGRVFATVGADSRPFAIVADDATVRDIGTSFSVTREGSATLVAVKEGEVDVRAAADAERGQRLWAGQKGGLDGDAFRPVRAANAYEDFGWTRSRLYFSDRPLGEVVAELRRYHRGWIILGDETIAAQRISGGLRLDDPAAAMAELARLSGGRLTRVSDAVLILR